MAAQSAALVAETYRQAVPRPDLMLRQHLDSRLVSLETWRLSWWTHWAQLASVLLPRRWRWLVPPSQWARGQVINQQIIDSTGTMAARVLASGLMSGTTSPSRPWFKLTHPDREIAEDPEVQKWMDEARGRMLRVMAGSNYYQAKAQQYEDLVIFGTAPMIIYEDYESIIRCYNPAVGEYYCAEGARFDVDTLFRKFTMTVSQVVDEFGLEACSADVRQAWETRGGAQDREIVICHAIEPNPDYVADRAHIGPGGESRLFKWREAYWEYGSSGGMFLRRRGFMEQPFSCPRWSVTGNDAYGRSPGMDALGDVKQLQVEQKRKAQAIDKMVNPPMLADPQLKNEPASLLPGAVTYVASGDRQAGFRPVYQVIPPINELKEDMIEVRQRIRDAFYNDIFLMINSMEGQQHTAYEVAIRQQEKLIQLGPVLERNENEGLGKDIDRIFNIMSRLRMFPPAPPALRDYPTVKVEYVSMLAEAQRAAEVTSIEQLWSFAGSLSAAYAGSPSLPTDNLDPDESVKLYANRLGTPARVMTAPNVVAQMRQGRQQAQAQQAAMQTGQVAVQGAQTLSETNVGGGQNALEIMLGGEVPL